LPPILNATPAGSTLRAFAHRSRIRSVAYGAGPDEKVRLKARALASPRPIFRGKSAVCGTPRHFRIGISPDGGNRAFFADRR